MVLSPSGLNESPSKKEGKLSQGIPLLYQSAASMKAPPKRKGNALTKEETLRIFDASMKAPPKRKGNSALPNVTQFSGSPQ